MPGHKQMEDYTSPLPHTYVSAEDIPSDFSWGSVNGTNLLTKSLNQHIPVSTKSSCVTRTVMSLQQQYCGSCWAHGAISALGDRIKIARKGQGIDINLAIQYILNCGMCSKCSIVELSRECCDILHVML